MDKSDLIILDSSDDIGQLTDDRNIVICEFYKEDIEGRKIGPALNKLLPLSDRPDLFFSLQDRLVFNVMGYDDDPRELYQVPAAKAYFTLLADNWPYFFHFCNAEMGTLGLLMALTAVSTNTTVISPDKIITDMRCSNAFLKKQLDGAIGLAKLHNKKDLAQYDVYLASRINQFFN